MKNQQNQNTAPTPLRPGNARTPYHALSSDGSPRIPGWARSRSVYRGLGRTYYLVETDRLGDARRDLKRLARGGWEVSVDQAAGPGNATITLSRHDLARAA